MEIGAELQIKSAEQKENKIDIKAKSVASEKHPNRNEDSFLIGDNFFGVFDGMGGLSQGDRASSMARDIVNLSFQKLPQNINLQQAKDAVSDALVSANQAVYKEGMEGMGTTASIGLIFEELDGSKKAIIGNVGDSRVYLLRNKTLEQITLDDNALRSNNRDENKARQLQSRMNNIVDPKKDLSENEQLLYGIRNQISQAIGIKSIEPRISVVFLLPSDKLFVCSDGVSDNLLDREIESMLNVNQDPDEAIRNLIDFSQGRGRSSHPRGKADDITALIVEVPANTKLSANVSYKDKIASLFNPKKSEQIPKVETIPPSSNLRVQRSDGRIEPGWKVSKFDNENGEAIVVKRIGNLDAVKHVPIATLERLNRPAKIEDIASAENLGQLTDILDQIGGIQGSKKKYNSAEIKEIVKMVLEGKAPLEAVTSTGGLKDLVRKWRDQ